MSDRNRIGGTSSGRVQLRRTSTTAGPGGATLEVRVSERPYRDASPGTEYPQAVAHVLLAAHDLAALIVLARGRLSELRGEEAVDELIEKCEYLYNAPPPRPVLESKEAGP